MISSSVSQNEKSPDIIYYNASIMSSRQVDQGFNTDPALRFMETRTNNIIDDISLYDFSIVRFTMDCGGDLPLFIPVVKAGTLNDTIYSFTMTYGTGAAMKTSQKYVQYVSESANPSIPYLNNVQDFGNRYYFVYTYQHWVNLCNTTIKACWDDLQTQAGAPFTAQCPKLVYNAATNLFSLYFDQAMANINFYMNSNMYQLFRNFGNRYYGTDATNGTNNLILVQNNLNNVSVINGVTYIIMTQDFPSTNSIWSPISSITFCSSLLPVNAEQIAAPVVYSTSSTYGTSQTSQGLYLPIITDISLPLDRSSDYKQMITYSPSSEYRMSSFIGTGSLNSIDVQVYWRCKYNQELYPITMPNGSSCTIKIMFRKKHNLK